MPGQAFGPFLLIPRFPVAIGTQRTTELIVVVVAAPRIGNFPYFPTVRGVLPAEDKGSDADPPFEAPLTGSIVTLPSTLPTLPST